MKRRHQPFFWKLIAPRLRSFTKVNNDLIYEGKRTKNYCPVKVETCNCFRRCSIHPEIHMNI